MPRPISFATRPHPFKSARLRRGPLIESGVTLLELAVVVSIIATAAMVAAPSLASYRSAAQLKTATAQFFDALQFTRAQAIARNSRVVICKSASGTSCANTGSWQQGWIVFVDTNANAGYDTAESILSRQQAISGVDISGNTNVASSLSYLGNGVARGSGGGISSGTITICVLSDGSGNAREVVLNTFGRPYVRQTTVTSCP